MKLFRLCFKEMDVGNRQLSEGLLPCGGTFSQGVHRIYDNQLQR
jgi:hypothetical protein